MPVAEENKTEYMSTIPVDLLGNPQEGLNIPEPDLTKDSPYVEASAKSLAEELAVSKKAQEESASLAEQKVKDLTGEMTGANYLEEIKKGRTAAGVDTAQADYDKLLEEIATRTEAFGIGKANADRAVKDLAGRGMGIPLSIVRGQQARLQNQQYEALQIEQSKIGKLTALAALKKGDVESAKELAKEAFDLEQNAKKVALDTEKAFLERNYDKLDATQRELADAKLKTIDEESKFLDLKATIKTNAFTSQAGKAMQEKINNATSKRELYSIPGIENYLISSADKLDLAIKGEQLQKLRLENGQEVTLPPSKLPNGQVDVVTELSNAIDASGKDVPQASTAIGIMAGLQKLALGNSDGKFVGSGNIRMPFGAVGGEKREERIGNTQDRKSIKSAVALWVSGASLTKQQEKDVLQMVPDKNDSDAKTKTKINNLTAFMQQQARAELAAKGITFSPTPVDYFAAPEEEKEVKDLEIDENGNIVLPDSYKPTNEEFFNPTI